MAQKAKKHNSLRSVFLRALLFCLVLAAVLPVAGGLFSAWSYLAKKFPGTGALPYATSFLAFAAVMILVSWIFGTQLVALLKTEAKSLWAQFMMKNLSGLEDGDGPEQSWLGREVYFAENGSFEEKGTITVWSLGFVTADLGDDVGVQFIYPPTGTGRFEFVKKKCGKVKLTGRSVKDHFVTVMKLGNGIQPPDML
ncbi:MAG: hypothetical protein Q7S36_03695 [Candidatus Liptonbacteria bacterium]|nr:hypothetical protein [Candidatus Liptonbacteria bacterium]